jgi:hypothetical protein
VLAIFLAVAFWRRASYRAQGSSLLIAVYWLAFAAIYRNGSAGDAQALLLSAVVLAVLLFGRAAGLVALLANVLLVAVMAWLSAGGGVGPTPESRVDGDMWLQPWFASTLVATVLGGALTFAVGQLVAGLETALAEETAHAKQLEACDGFLTRATEELSQGNSLLSRRSDALHAAVSVALEVTPTLAEDVLLDHAAALIGEKCGFFHVGIFLLDPSG